MRRRFLFGLEVCYCRLVPRQIEHTRVEVVLSLVVDFVVLRVQEVDEVGALRAVQILQGGLCEARLFNVDQVVSDPLVLNTPPDAVHVSSLRVMLRHVRRCQECPFLAHFPVLQILLPS